MSFKKWQQTDVVMAEYFADLYEVGETYNEASYTLFGLFLLRTIVSPRQSETYILEQEEP